MKNNIRWIDGLGGLITLSLLWWLIPKPCITTTPSKPRRSGTRRPHFIGTLRLDSWVLELIENPSYNEDFDLILVCGSSFYISDHSENRSRKDVTKGITADFNDVWDMIIPIKSLKELKNATSALVCCKYNSGPTAYREGTVKIEKREDS